MLKRTFLRENISRKKIRFAVLSIILFFTIFLVVSCSNSSNSKDLQNTKIKLKWFHQAQFAGNYVALEKGYYADEGINASLYQYEMGENYIEKVAEGVYDFGITGADELIIARSKGVNVKAIAVIYKTSPVCAYTIDKSILTPNDFVEKTVGIEKGINVEYLYYIMMERLRVDRSKINEVGIGFDSSEIPNGLVDVATGYSINEPNVLKEKGHNVTVFLMADYGADTYADVLFTSGSMIENNPEIVQSFVTATLKGWAFVLNNPKESVDYVMKYANSSNKHQELMIKESVPFIFYDELPLGMMTYEEWDSLGELLYSINRTDYRVNVEELYINDFVEYYYAE